MTANTQKKNPASSRHLSQHDHDCFKFHMWLYALHVCIKSCCVLYFQVLLPRTAFTHQVGQNYSCSFHISFMMQHHTIPCHTLRHSTVQHKSYRWSDRHLASIAEQYKSFDNSFVPQLHSMHTHCQTCRMQQCNASMPLKMVI